MIVKNVLTHNNVYYITNLYFAKEKKIKHVNIKLKS